jgi:hypothetical protein
LESNNILKRSPILNADLEKADQYFKRIEYIIQERQEIEIEDLKIFLVEITSSYVEFEFPRYRLEPIFNVINEKL